MSDPTPPGIPPVPPEVPYTAPPVPPPSFPAMPEVPQSYGGMETALTENDKNFGMLSHLIAFAGVVVPFPFVNVAGPLIVWMTQKDKSSYLDYHGKESLNFQITVAIAVVVCLLLMVVLIGFLLLPLVGLYAIVMTIIAGIKAKDGVRYRYPYTLRLVK